MSSQRFIKQESTASGVTYFVADDLFSADFQVYKLILDNINPSTSNYVHMRMVNSTGSIIATSEYDVAIYSLYTYGSYASEGRAQNGTKWDKQVYANTDSDNGAMAVIYVFNPFDNDKHTLIQGESVGQDGDIGGKTIGLLKNFDECTGVMIYPNSGTFDNARIRAYGIRMD